METQKAHRNFTSIVLAVVPMLLLVSPLMTLSFNLGLITEKGKAAGPYVSIADILLLVISGAFLIALFLNKEWRKLRFPTFAGIALFCWYLTGFLRTTTDVNVGSMAILKESLQIFEYLIVGYVLFLSSMYCRRNIRLFADVLGGIVTIVLGIALLHYIDISVPDFSVCGTFQNNNQLGAFIAVILPLLVAYAIGTPGIWRRLWCIVLVGSSFAVILNGWFFIALIAGISVAFAMYGRWAAIIGITATAIFAGLLLPNLPRENTKALWSSASIYRKDNTGMVPKGQDRKQFVVSTRVRNWQAALNAAREKFITGYAPSSYSNAVRPQFFFDPKFPASTADPRGYDIHVDEPDTFSTYLIMLVEEGIVGLLLFAALLFAALRWASTASASFGLTGSLGKGVFSSLIALLFAAHFINYLDRSLAFTFVFLVAFAYALSEYALQYRDE